MRGAAIDDQENRMGGADHQSLENSIKTSAFTPPFALIMNRIRPFEVIAESRLMAWRAPVVEQSGFRLLAEAASCVMIGTYMRRVAKIDVRGLRLAILLIFGYSS